MRAMKPWLALVVILVSFGLWYRYPSRGYDEDSAHGSWPGISLC